MQKDTDTASIDYNDLELAFHFTSGGYLYDSAAYVCRKSGKIYYESDAYEDEDDVPDNLDEDGLYAQVPGQHDLDLGKPLVFEFAARSLSDKYEKVESMFRRKGAYQHYKEFLFECGKLDEWYRFEQDAIEKALHEWAEQEGFTIVNQATATKD